MCALRARHTLRRNYTRYVNKAEKKKKKAVHRRSGNNRCAHVAHAVKLALVSLFLLYLKLRFIGERHECVVLYCCVLLCEFGLVRIAHRRACVRACDGACVRVHGGYRFNAIAPRAYPREAYVKYNNQKSGAEIMPYTTNYLLARGFFLSRGCSLSINVRARARATACEPNTPLGGGEIERALARPACMPRVTLVFDINNIHGWLGWREPLGRQHNCTLHEPYRACRQHTLTCITSGCALANYAEFSDYIKRATCARAAHFACATNC